MSGTNQQFGQYVGIRVRVARHRVRHPVPRQYDFKPDTTIGGISCDHQTPQP